MSLQSNHKPQATSHKPQATSHKPQATQDSTLVSIIIPAYNTAPYIHRAIGSSLRQTHRNIEILIVDDGSTDDTLRVAEYFAGTDSRIRVFTQKNAGVSAARNHGINEAKGEYLVFLDSDDWLEDDAIEILLDAQREHPGCVICADYCWNVKIKEGVLFRPAKDKTISSRLINIQDIAESYCHFQGSIMKFHVLHAKLFQASFGILFAEGITWSEDAIFFLEYFLNVNKAYYINKPVVNVLDRQGSTTRSAYRPEFTNAVVKAHEIILDLVKGDKETTEMMLISRNEFLFQDCLKRAMGEKADKSEIYRIRSFISPYARYTLKCQRYPLKMRAMFFLAVFAPLPVCKAVIFIWNFLKSLRGKKKPDEVIPDWQDFPKAPGIPV